MKRVISMFPKISLAAGFVLLLAPPMACATNVEVTNRAAVSGHAQERPPGFVLAQNSPPDAGASVDDNASDDSNDRDPNDGAYDSQNSDGSQADQQNAAGDDQPPVPGAPDNDPGNAQQAPPQASPYQ
jgi:hypothetical protein